MLVNIDSARFVLLKLKLITQNVLPNGSCVPRKCTIFHSVGVNGETQWYMLWHGYTTGLPNWFQPAHFYRKVPGKMCGFGAHGGGKMEGSVWGGQGKVQFWYGRWNVSRKRCW